MNRLSGVLLFFALVFGIVGAGIYSMTDPTPRRLASSGLISAGGADLPYMPCLREAPADAMALTLGNATLWFRGFPHSVVTVDGQPQFTIDRDKDGMIAVDIRIIAGTRELGRLRGVTLEDESNGQLRLMRPNGSALVIQTANGTPVLQVNYINGHALRVTGRLAFGGHDFTMPVDGFLLDKSDKGNTCLGGDRKVDFAF